jgi:hypothetical protein
MPTIGLASVLEHRPHRPRPHFRRLTRPPRHRSILSRSGASGKPGALHTHVVGIFRSEAAITRLVGALLLEQSDEWAVQRARHMTLETMAPLSDSTRVSLPALPA